MWTFNALSDYVVKLQFPHLKISFSGILIDLRNSYWSQESLLTSGLLISGLHIDLRNPYWPQKSLLISGIFIEKKSILIKSAFHKRANSLYVSNWNEINTHKHMQFQATWNYFFFRIKYLPKYIIWNFIQDSSLTPFTQ